MNKSLILKLIHKMIGPHSYYQNECLTDPNESAYKPNDD